MENDLLLVISILTFLARMNQTTNILCIENFDQLKDLDKFFSGFANYYKSLLNVSTDRHKHQIFVRKDNYDLMAYLGEVLIANNTDILICMNIFYNTTDFFQMGVFSKCVRRLFEVNSEHVKIYPKGTAWVRDIWLTNSMWSLSDFMLHGCKGNGSVANTKPRIAEGSSRFWYNPYSKPFDFTECVLG
ncbi:unnamed protein product [Cylicostephanus goldi]|uniref:Nucleotide-diphospho-sugar transferase domain-containing protein n=1 Tax=Cylicostephanus goldi TaxID=71465 RepID=A0A3P6QNV3_CYLGO|nr:unnamed protein product [Cylicostephanus goldi]